MRRQWTRWCARLIVGCVLCLCCALVVLQAVLNSLPPSVLSVHFFLSLSLSLSFWPYFLTMQRLRLDRTAEQKAQERRDVMAQRLGMYNLRLRTKILGDGNCQFRAVADLLWPGDQDAHSMVRAAAIAWLRKHADTEMQPGDPETKVRRFIHGESWEDYLRRMSRDREWGDELTLRAIANQYQIVLCVLSDVVAKGSSSPVREIAPLSGAEDKPHHWLAHFAEVHYESLESVESNRQVDQQKLFDEWSLNLGGWRFFAVDK